MALHKGRYTNGQQAHENVLRIISRLGMQTTTKMKKLSPRFRMAKKMGHTKRWWVYRTTRTRMIQPLWEIVQFLRKLNIYPPNPISRYLPMRNEKRCPQRDSYTNAHSCFNHSSPHMEETQAAERINKLWYSHNNRILYNNKEDWTEVHDRLSETLSWAKVVKHKWGHTLIPFIWNPRIVKTNLWWYKSKEWLSLGGKGDWLKRGKTELSGVMELFYILTAVSITWV